MAVKIKASREKREEAKEYIKAHLSDYLERCGINPSRNFPCLNPLHDDSHGDMSFHRPSNTCVCHCGARYDTFDLIGIDYGMTDFNGKFQKGCEIFALLGQEENDDDIKLPQGWRELLPTQQVAERAADEDCSICYYELLKAPETALRKEHKEDLLRRGLTEDDIKRFRFRSTPQKGDTSKVMNHISSKGILPVKVPGFYLNERGYWAMVNDTDGYYCPVFNGERNQILGFQIRADKPDKRGKYVWFSSSRKDSGTSSGAIPTFLPGKDESLWIVTEGILKALIIYCLLGKEVSVIGVPGVGTISGFKSFMEEKTGLDFVFIEAYDMDKVEDNKMVKQAQENLLKEIEKAGFKSHSLTWDSKDGKWQKNFKGLDDFLCEYVKTDGNREKFIRYLKKIKSDLLKKTA